MRTFGVSCLIGLVAAAATAQDSRPTSQPAETRTKSRNGGFHGIRFAERDDDGGKALEVTSVMKGSDAERLGFLTGDRILGINGLRLRDGDHFIQMLYCTLPYREVGQMRVRMGLHLPKDGSWFDVSRDGEEVEVRGGMEDLDSTPAVGDVAPRFTLSDAAGENEVALADLIGKRPVVLVFGSYT